MRAKSKTEGSLIDQDNSDSFPEPLMLGQYSNLMLDEPPPPHYKHAKYPKPHHNSDNLKREYNEEEKDTPGHFDASKCRKVDYNQEYHQQTNDFLMQGTPLKSGKIY